MLGILIYENTKFILNKSNILSALCKQITNKTDNTVDQSDGKTQ